MAWTNCHKNIVKMAEKNLKIVENYIETLGIFAYLISLKILFVCLFVKNVPKIIKTVEKFAKRVKIDIEII